MKTAIATAMSLSLFVVLGCASPKGGGAADGEEFTIITPAFDTQLKQGETESVTVKLHRGEFFKRDVTLVITTSSGLSVEPAQAVIKASEMPDVHLRITAAKDAPIGKYRIVLKGTPETGEPTSTELTVKVVYP